MNSIRCEALEYKYPLHILAFLAFRIKNPFISVIGINNIIIVHHSIFA